MHLEMAEKCRQFCLGLNVLILSEPKVAVLAVQFIGLRGYKRALRVILSILVKNNKVSLITGLFYNRLFNLCSKLLQPVTTKIIKLSSNNQHHKNTLVAQCLEVVVKNNI